MAWRQRAFQIIRVTYVRVCVVRVCTRAGSTEIAISVYQPVKWRHEYAREWYQFLDGGHTFSDSRVVREATSAFLSWIINCASTHLDCNSIVESLYARFWLRLAVTKRLGNPIRDREHFPSFVAISSDKKKKMVQLPNVSGVKLKEGEIDRFENVTCIKS